MYLEKLVGMAGLVSFSVVAYIAGLKAVAAITGAAHQWAGAINHALGGCQ